MYILVLVILGFTLCIKNSKFYIAVSEIQMFVLDQKKKKSSFHAIFKSNHKILKWGVFYDPTWLGNLVIGFMK